MEDLCGILDIGEQGGLVQQRQEVKKYKPGTIFNKINTLKRFFNFVEINKHRQLGCISDTSTLTDYRAYLNGLQAYLNKLRRCQSVANDDETGLDTINKEVWEKFERSACWRKKAKDIEGDKLCRNNLHMLFVV